jgi:3-oxoacyl-[acyl-carrier-protein] synthase II
VGVVSPLGLNAEATWEAALKGQSGAAPIAAFDPGEYGIKTTIAAEVHGFVPTDFLDAKEAKRLDRFTQLAAVAADEALENASLTLDDGNAEQVGVIIATGIGGIYTIAEQYETLKTSGSRRVNPFTIPMLMSNAASGIVSIRSGAQGPCFSVASACASSTDSVGIALDTIRSGRARAMIAGGTDGAIHPLVVSGFEQARALCSDSNDHPARASRPFDKTRSGFVIGEGAAILILEEESFARERGAPILCELAGYSSQADSYHITAPAPDARGAVRAIERALADANASAQDVVYVNAHGTSTQLNDAMETKALRTAFGSHADNIAVSSTKSMTGHLGGAAGALEAFFSAYTVANRVAPPTINYHEPDPDCDLDYIPHEARPIDAGVVLSNSFGFGGHSSCLAFRPVEGESDGVI